MKKFISILLTFAMMAMMMTSVFATIPEPTTDKIPQEAQNLAADVLGLIKWVGIIFAVGMLLYIGIKYMMSAANEKADLKKGLINYVIGAAILFAASAIVGFIQSWISSAA